MKRYYEPTVTMSVKPEGKKFYHSPFVGDHRTPEQKKKDKEFKLAKAAAKRERRYERFIRSQERLAAKRTCA